MVFEDLNFEQQRRSWIFLADTYQDSLASLITSPQPGSFPLIKMETLKIFAASFLKK